MKLIHKAVTLLVIGFLFSQVFSIQTYAASIVPINNCMTISTNSAILPSPCFSGLMTDMTICCNGIRFTINQNERRYNTVYGDFIFPWQNMIPDPILGTGLFENYVLGYEASGKKADITGDVYQKGFCITVESECESQENVDYTVRKMGSIFKSSQAGIGVGLTK